ncbi:MAG: hypothetical protein ACON5A_03835 [Candidatus Comchoanobacterales bacterium]
MSGKKNNKLRSDKLDLLFMLHDEKIWSDDDIKRFINHAKNNGWLEFSDYIHDRLSYSRVYTDPVHKRNFKIFWDNLDFEDKKSIVKNVKKRFAKDYRFFIEHLDILDDNEIKDCLRKIKAEYSNKTLTMSEQLKKIFGNDAQVTQFHDTLKSMLSKCYLSDDSAWDETSIDQRKNKFLKVWENLSEEDRGLLLLDKDIIRFASGFDINRMIASGLDYNTLFRGQSDLVKVYSLTEWLVGELIYTDPKGFKAVLKVVHSVSKDDQQFFIKFFRYSDLASYSKLANYFNFPQRVGGPLYHDDGSLSDDAKEMLPILIPILMNEMVDHYDGYSAQEKFIKSIFSPEDAVVKVIEFIKLFKDNPLVIKEILSCVKKVYPKLFKAVKKDKYLKNLTILNWKNQDFKNASEIISMSEDLENKDKLFSYLEYKCSGTTNIQPRTDYKAVLCDLMVRLTPNELSMLSSAVGLEESNGVNVNCSFLAKVSQSRIKASLKRKIQKSFARNHEPDVKNVLKK